ncbi:MAG: hypothetical protein Q9174_000886 [Haloplaca sp. 1 TL-2023]
MAGALDKSEASNLTDSTRLPESVATNQDYAALKDIAFGSVAGIIGKTFEYPFDTIKVRLQSQPHPAIYTGPLDCFWQSWRSPEGGFRSLYRGVSAPLFGAAIETSSLFLCYGIAQSTLQTLFPELPQGKGEKLPLGPLVACGAISGAATSLLLTPIELVKCKMQYPVAVKDGAGMLRSHARPPGPLSVIASVFRNHGILGFWHGQLGTLIRETGGTAAWFGSYEFVLKALQPPSSAKGQDQLSTPTSHQLLAGASAGVMYNFVFFPADTIKSRMQTEELAASSETSPKGKPPTAFWHTGKELWRQQGLRGLYQGCGITVLRSAPSSAIIFATVEWLRRWAAGAGI